MECALENITLHYETYGEGRPILFIPGWGLNARLTADQMEGTWRVESSFTVPGLLMASP